MTMNLIRSVIYCVGSFELSQTQHAENANVQFDFLQCEMAP
jgi:hypothetical protein